MSFECNDPNALWVRVKEKARDLFIVARGGGTPEPAASVNMIGVALTEEENRKVDKLFADAVAEHKIREGYTAQQKRDIPSAIVVEGKYFVVQGDLNLRNRDIYRLTPTEMLSDEIINFYFGCLQERELERSKPPKSHLFSSFFYNKLYSEQKVYNYNNVNRWVRLEKIGYDVLQCENIYVPIHLKEKKTLGARRHRREIVQSDTL